jgi:hypothetical protein
VVKPTRSRLPPLGQAPPADDLWPPKIVWSRERGWLNVRDPVTGQWFGIPAKEAPRGWSRIATQAKYEP